jgi:hypothetical protein
MALAFAAGLLFAISISLGLDHAIVPRAVGIATFGISIAVVITIVLLGVRGRLPGTK